MPNPGKSKRDPNQPVRAAGILLMTRCDPTEFLLMRHPDRWDLPKGHCEPGESFAEAALRETQEETGIDADQICLDDDFRFELTYPVRYKKTGDQEFTKHVAYFLGWVKEPHAIRLTEHDGFHWMQWAPPHCIQEQTIDPLLAAVQAHLASSH
ncbi:bis(5'-nucleosyl)-tetraphosphatase [Stieleria varia]|uniref:Bis(5'-nucleosyl)-tetraphosphatase [asymmetrical] n=1 Tax=Stieleria varia TaxID=2528005 RepID=A0A5C6AN04_9BACT|nr:NUDIX domain-containing protein [Stieleria varia]TWU00898.1 Diadenosine hexaphosphate hydrolase [Stieleria varia]